MANLKHMHIQRHDNSYRELAGMVECREIVFAHLRCNWTQQEKSAFIQSLLLEIPRNPMCMVERNNGKYVIVDGIKRLQTWLEYSSGRFYLEGCAYLPNATFNNLPDRTQRALRQNRETVYTVRDTTPGAIREALITMKPFSWMTLAQMPAFHPGQEILRTQTSSTEGGTKPDA